jgi:hypothetical protein
MAFCWSRPLFCTIFTRDAYLCCGAVGTGAIGTESIAGTAETLGTAAATTETVGMVAGMVAETVVGTGMGTTEAVGVIGVITADGRCARTPGVRVPSRCQSVTSTRTCCKTEQFRRINFYTLSSYFAY